VLVVARRWDAVQSRRGGGIFLDLQRWPVYFAANVVRV